MEKITVIVAGLSILLWIGFYIFHFNRLAIFFRGLVTIVLITGLTCRILFALLTPCFYAPDEQSHYNYIKYLYEHKHFPVQTTMPGAPSNEWEYHQPPVYYLSLVPVYWLSNKLFEDRVILKVIALRIFSILLWLVNVFMAYKIVTLLFPENIFIKTFTLSIVCLLPTYAFLSSTINNDNLLITIGGTILYLLLTKRTFGNSILTGILLGLALLTKFNAIIFAFAIVAVFTVQLVKKGIAYKTAASHLTIILLIAFILWSPWAYRTWSIYGDVTATKATNVYLPWDSFWSPIIYIQAYLKCSFWSVSGIYNNIYFLPHVGIYLTYISALGLMYAYFFKRPSINTLMTSDALRYISAMGFSVILNFIMVMRFGWLYGQGQGRFLFPVLIPIAIFMAMGIELLLKAGNFKNASIHIVGFFVTYVLSFLTYSIAAFPKH